MKHVKRIAAVSILAAALGACAQEKPSPLERTSAAQPTTDAINQQKPIDQMNAAKAALIAQRSALDAQLQAQKFQIRGGGAFVSRADPFGYTFNGTDTPVLLVTAPMDEKVRGEWKEDLSIMNKLLENAVQSSGENGFPQAMGIPIQTTGRVAPIYMEDCGLIFRLGVNIPLATSGKFPVTRPSAPATKPSAWELTKRQLSGRNAVAIDSDWQMYDSQGRSVTPSHPTFDQDKVDSLIATLIAQLPEATHFRHLGAGEWIFVSVSGSDDAGAPKRLTLKVNKSDIDDAASGKLKSDEFKRRVARSIG